MSEALFPEHSAGDLAAAEAWARSRGHTEVASDARLDNLVSHAVHRSAGYEEVDRIVQFRKQIG